MKKIPTELDRIGRVTIYAGSEERRQVLKALCKWDDQNRSLSELIEVAVREFLEHRGVQLEGEPNGKDQAE